MQNPDFSEIVALICKEDPRFDRRAYEFVRLGLDHTVKELRKRDTDRAEKSRHVTGPELLIGIIAFFFLPVYVQDPATSLRHNKPECVPCGN